jgi:hypothetical protein
MIRKILVLLGLLAVVSMSATMLERITVTCNGVTTTYAGEIIFTDGNQVGIANNDVCVFDTQANVIACTSGKIFRNPQRYDYHAGTLEQGLSSSLIGKIARRPTPGMIGSGGYTAFSSTMGGETCSPHAGQMSDVILPEGMGVQDNPPMMVDPNPFRR